MMLRRAAIAFLCLTGCSAVGPTRPVAHEESAISKAGISSSEGPSIPDSAQGATINPAPGTVDAEPTTERVVGYVAIIGGVIALTILAIGFYKLAKLLSH